MLIFLYGQNTYSAYQKLKEITDHYKKIHKTGLNFKIFDLEEKKILYQDFQNEWKQVSMFRSEEHTSELQSHSFISYAVFCLKKKN